MEPEYILFIDDNINPLKPILDVAAKAKGLNVIYAEQVSEGFQELAKNSDNINAVVLDLLFTGQPTQGEEALADLREKYPNIPVVVLTESYDNTATAIRCIKNGAYDFMGKTSLDPSHLFHVLGNAISQAKLKKRIPKKSKIDSDLTSPALLFQKEELLCQFAYKLNSISMQSDTVLLDSILRASYRWHYNLLHIITSSYHEYAMPSLFMVKNSSKAQIDFYLVFSLYESNKENLIALANEFIAAVEPYVLSIHESPSHPYVLEPIVDIESLKEILYPNFVNPAVRLYSEPICWGDPADYNLDMNDGIQSLGAEFLPKIYPGELYSNYNLLALSLLSSIGTSHLSIHIQPLRLRNNEKEFIQKIIDGEVLPSVDLPEEKVNEYITKYKSIESAPPNHFLFEVRYISDIHSLIPKPLDIEIKRHFYSEGSNVKFTLQKGLFDNLFSIDKHMKLSRLSFTKANKEVAFLFRLPEPVAKPVKGLPYQNASIQIIPANLAESGLLLGEKKIGAETRSIRIDTDSLKKHMYVLGQTGTGKTTLLISMIHDAISGHHGFCVIDPHGDLIEDVEKMIPDFRKKDIVWFDTNKLDTSAKLNLLNPEVFVKPSMLIDELIRILSMEYDYKIVGGPMFETYFKSVLNLIMQPKIVEIFKAPTIKLAYKALLIPDFLDHLLSLVKDEIVPISHSEDYLTDKINTSELDLVFKNALKSKGDHDWDTIRPYIYSKLKFFVDNEYISVMFDNNQPTLNFREIMDNGQILLVRMEKGCIGPANLAKVGMLFLNNMISSIMSRTELPTDKRRDFFIFIDEFQNFMHGDIGSALSEVRKYNVGLVLANQTIGQLDDFLIQSVLGNVGSTAFFRTGINDINKIRHFVEPEFTAREIINLPNFNCIARIMHNNRPSEPFNFETVKLSQ